ncbi:MAG TPA: GNAT family N-acetyltransferase [Pyrinomonadaceae bacterium]|nr:GNAT family N-acetyltransferase [Pyrinomonadaceae bacterium]
MLELTNDKRQTASLTPESNRTVQPLKGEHEAEVLDFLSAHPLLTFVMTGWIKDNGLVSQLNRGTFYGSRNERGELDGVALIGHVNLFETNSEAALSAFAELIKDCPSAFVLMGQQQKVSRLMAHYSSDDQPVRKTFRECLFEQRSKERVEDPVGCLRRATPEEVDLVVPVHAAMTLEETGVNPLEVDPTGFRKRCLRRIEQGRVWVCIKDGQLVFKADVISDLPDVVYLEGVYVRPENRGQGLGTRCMKQLTNILLTHTKSVCVLTKEEKSAAQACYRKAGYRLREFYETLQLEQKSDALVN